MTLTKETLDKLKAWNDAARRNSESFVPVEPDELDALIAAAEEVEKLRVEIEHTKKLLRDANRGAQVNAHVNQGIASNWSLVVKERDAWRADAERLAKALELYKKWVHETFEPHEVPYTTNVLVAHAQLTKGANE